MKGIRFDRLEILANHLLTGKLGHDNFYLGTYNDGTIKEDGCGTSGCAIGECPIVFPEYWHFKRVRFFAGEPSLIRNSNDVVSDSREFFNINTDEFCHLFIAQYQKPLLYGGRALIITSRRSTVGKNILEFIDEMKKEKS